MGCSMKTMTTTIMAPATHHAVFDPPPDPEDVGRGRLPPGLRDSPGIGGGPPVANAAPHEVQNRAPGVACAPHCVQKRFPTAVPQDAQKFPDASAPHSGH